MVSIEKCPECGNEKLNVAIFKAPDTPTLFGVECPVCGFRDPAEIGDYKRRG